jgi:glycosidase
VWFPHNGYFFYSTFSAYSPDLNLTNPQVVDHIYETARFWLEDVGVDGFRLDSAKHAVEEGEIQANTTSTHEWWKQFRLFYKSVNPQAMTVGEVWEHTSINAEYLQGDEFDVAFEFSLSYEILNAINNQDADILNQQIALSYNLIPPLQFSTFLTNHDQDRLMDQLGFSTDKVRVAASILLTAPGVPFLYYGEEVGMQGTGHDGARLPMQWSDEPYAGFSAGSPWTLLGFDWEYYNVANQTGDPASLLSHYRYLIQARNQHAALRVGDLHVVNTGSSALYSILRLSQEEAVLVLINLTGNSVTDVQLILDNSSLAEGSYLPAVIMGAGDFPAVTVNGIGGFRLAAPISAVPPYATLILQLQPVSP